MLLNTLEGFNVKIFMKTGTKKMKNILIISLKKLKIPKITLFAQTEITNEIKNYTNLVYRKIEDLKTKVNYKIRCYLNKKVKIALKELKILLK